MLLCSALQETVWTELQRHAEAVAICGGTVICNPSNPVSVKTPDLGMRGVCGVFEPFCDRQQPLEQIAWSKVSLNALSTWQLPQLPEMRQPTQSHLDVSFLFSYVLFASFFLRTYASPFRIRLKDSMLTIQCEHVIQALVHRHIYRNKTMMSIMHEPYAEG